MKKHVILTAVMLVFFAMTAGMARADDDVDFGSGSFGIRAANLNPKDGDDVWFGGAQLRFFMGDVFALEGSIDYRQDDIGRTELDVYPVQATLLAYLIPDSY